MPRKPSRPCRYPGCPNFCESGAVYCPEHMKDNSVNLREKWRGSAASRGYDSRWRRARRAFLQAHPLCAECLRNGRYTAATVVDHIIPHRGDMNLFWDERNWQSLCRDCHDEKTGSGL